MTSARLDEVWAAACIELALPGVTARQNDDGRDDGMYDIELVRGGAPFGACEVTAVADAAATEQWSAVTTHGGGRWIEPTIAGGWILVLEPGCRVKTLRQRVRSLLGRLEQNPFDQVATAELESLGVASARRSDTNFPGSIYCILSRDSDLTGGFVSDNGDALVHWFNSWVNDPSQSHNLAKLRRSRLPERHLFLVFPGYADVPFSAYDLLLRNDAPLPTNAPTFPQGLTHVWITSTWDAGEVFHANTRGWTRHPKATITSNP